MTEDEKDEKAKKRKLEALGYHFELIVEYFTTGWHGPHIELRESRDIEYLIEQLVEATGAPADKIEEGIEHWMNGIYRKYG